ncbi:MAG: cell division protein FtsZ, partial [Haloarculaceae archaeon]
ARIQEEYKGKVRVMAIMTGVQSAQVLGPSTAKQAEKSRQAIQEVGDDDQAFDASQNVHGGVEASNDSRSFGQTDGGRNDLDTNNGLDVVHTD